MREESRFNPRAKSEAAARGLMQFIITTAAEIGRDIGLVDVTPDDLYDPRIIIRLGAKYIGELIEEVRRRPLQDRRRLQRRPRTRSRSGPASRPHPATTTSSPSINFDETKDYVRKVMNSYKRYGEIYGDSGPQGGLRAEP